MIFITSVDPKNESTIEVNSWREIGEVYSVNTLEEINILKDRYPFIHFIESTTAYKNSEMYGKPYVSINELVELFKSLEGDVCCLLNSDIYLKQDVIWKSAERYARDSKLVLVKRWNYTNSFDDATLEPHGIDCFIFNKDIANKVPPNQPFMIGQTWWDYWLPSLGYPLAEIKSPIAYHKAHQVRWSRDSWKKMGQELAKSMGIILSDNDSDIGQFGIKAHKEIFSKIDLITPNIYDFIDYLDLKSPTIFEFGTHHGEDTVRLSAIKDSIVHTFECEPENIKFISNKLPSNVILNKIAIGKLDGKSEFFRSKSIGGENWKQSGSVKPPKNHLIKYPHVDFEDKSITVDIITLDTYCKNTDISDIDFIWCDIQGNEVDMIDGGKESLRRTKYLYTEYSNCEMYNGQGTLNDIKQSLPDFEVVHDFGINGPGEGNILFKNKRYSNGRT